MQQINLYHPLFRAQRLVFSAKTIAAALGVVFASLLGIWLFGRSIAAGSRASRSSS